MRYDSGDEERAAISDGGHSGMSTRARTCTLRDAPDLKEASRQVRRIILEQSKRANVGHIGSSLCIAEILVVLYGRILRRASVDDPERDRFLLGKGHAALALYATLQLDGVLSETDLETYCSVHGTRLGVHPDHHLPGVDFSTGALGQAITFGAGAALAARMQGSRRRVFVLVSDAECNEGSLWEAAMFAAHNRLSNLVVIVDDNGQQAFGKTADVLRPSSLDAQWGGVGWTVERRDGHDPERLTTTLEGIDTDGAGSPTVVIAQTIFGKGVSYMEGQIKWHYWPMSDEEYAQALREVETGP
jgi:transketolase